MNQLIASSKITAVVGLGVTGLSAVRYLAKKQCNFVVFDSRLQPPGLEEFKKEFPDVAIHLGGFDADDFQNIEEIILSPGLSRATPVIAELIEQGVSVIGDIELFARDVKAPVIAITGSNGKSTVTTLVGEMAKHAGLKVAVGGNLGTPALDLLAEGIDLYVLELSSFQLESTSSLQPAVATILNLSADHMDRYESMIQYHQAKQRIYRNAKTIVVNRDDPLTSPPIAEGVKVVRFGLGQPDLNDFGLQNGDVLALGLSHLVQADELKIRGKHNIANALAALALGQAVDLPFDAMLSALEEFKGLTHRCEFVAEKNGVRYFNDSKATNVGATVAALEGMASRPEQLIVIVGGDGKGLDFSPLLAPINEYAKAVITIGQDGPAIGDLVRDNKKVIDVSSMTEAVEHAAQLATNDDIVLLSPACASLDMYRNYEERGELFKKAVEALS